MDQQRLAALIERYLSDDLSREEAEQLMHSLSRGEHRGQWNASLEALLENKSAHGLSDPSKAQAVLASIIAKQQPATPVHRIGYWSAAAAAVLLIGLTALFFYNKQAVKTPVAKYKAPVHQVKPGGNKAVLTLADGTEITLDSTGNGAIANQGNMQVIKLDSGQLAYNMGKGPKDGIVSYNTLTTPRGGQFQIILPDGTKVWLNAASSLRYPTAFTGKERNVQLTGEAYFEVAKKNGMPFTVGVKDMQVRVLGTHFNIMAYQDESAIRTTLLEGAVRVQHGTKEMQLTPGQQAQLRPSGEMALLRDVDLEETVAWKNGYFQFERESLMGVMRQISRWYDAEISYQGKVPDREFGGKIKRSSSIDEVLKILELSNVHFRLEDKKITVIP